jgi:hypothetical protein
MQDALASEWKSTFPNMKFLSYRIQSAVPYDKVVGDKIKSDPDFFVRWTHEPGSTVSGNGSVCYNYLSPVNTNFLLRLPPLPPPRGRGGRSLVGQIHLNYN